MKLSNEVKRGFFIFLLTFRKCQQANQQAKNQKLTFFQNAVKLLDYSLLNFGVFRHRIKTPLCGVAGLKKEKAFESPKFRHNYSCHNYDNLDS